MEQEHQSTMEEAEEEVFRSGDLGTSGGSHTRWNDPGGYSTDKVQFGQQGVLACCQEPSGRQLAEEIVANKLSEIAR